MWKQVGDAASPYSVRVAGHFLLETYYLPTGWEWRIWDSPEPSFDADIDTWVEGPEPLDTEELAQKAAEDSLRQRLTEALQALDAKD